MKRSLIIPILTLFLSSCGDKTTEADAYGNFEAEEVVVSAETAGRILAFEAEEGSGVSAGDLLAIIDTTLLSLQKAELEAGIRAIRTKMITVDAQNAILSQQAENLAVNVKRTENLLKDDAATRKQLDDLTGQMAVIDKQIAANNSQKTSVAAELGVHSSRMATLMEQMSRCIVKSPVEGILIEKYSDAGEITAPGKPLAKIADLREMKLTAYVSGAQLGRVKTGDRCTVRIDQGEKGYKTYQGTINYISEKAEFTPKIIQTKEERVSLVYAVKIRVVNDGSIKSGMPGEVIFNEGN